MSEEADKDRIALLEGLLERTRDLLTVWDCEYVALFGDIKAALQKEDGRG